MTNPGNSAEPFEAHRGHLISVAYRMLGSRTEAEDAVQEAWLRYAAARPDPDNLRAWLTTVTARICLDQLRSARVRRTTYTGPWLPEPLVTRLPDPGQPDPAETVSRTEEVSLALLYVLERLAPEQRVAFVLHDVFDVPFDQIASALDTSPAAARQLASRARRAVSTADAPRHTADAEERRRVLAAFLAAANQGDLAGLIHILAPDVVLVGDGGGLAPAVRKPVTGALGVARFLLGLFRQAEHLPHVRAEAMLVNGAPGLVVAATWGDRPLTFVMSFAVADGRIEGIFNQLNPDKLSGVPAPRTDWPLSAPA